MYNPHKTISATEKGINISFLDKNVKKRTYVMYEPSPFSKIELQNVAKYQKIHQDNFNIHQNKLYQQLVYGLSCYEDEILDKMPIEKKYFIKTRFVKAQNIINQLKQNIVNSSVNNMLLKFFPKSKIAKELANTNGYNEHYWCKFTFKELNLTKIVIAEHLIKHGLLPKNFFQLK